MLEIKWPLSCWDWVCIFVNQDRMARPDLVLPYVLDYGAGAIEKVFQLPSPVWESNPNDHRIVL